MKYQGIRKIHEGGFITRYDVDYETEEGKRKTYEIVSRNRNIRTLEELQNKKADSVVIIVTDESGERILLNREYRMAMAQWIYNFPAGLIDPGETPEESARRELREETGLVLERIDDVLDNSYSAAGFSNERNICLFGKASGTFHESTSAEEEIVPGWFTKEEVRELLRREAFAGRTQAYCYLWADAASFLKEKTAQENPAREKAARENPAAPEPQPYDQVARQVACGMLLQGLPLDMIQVATGIPYSVLEELKSQIAD